jgi:hypothetical protein
VASFPGNLTIPQLLWSSVWVIVPLVVRGPTTVFPHRELSPHQFTPMSGAHGGERTEASHSGQGLFVAQSWLASAAHARRPGTRLVPLAMVILQ